MHRILASPLFTLLAAVGGYSLAHAEDVQSGLFACAKLGDNLERVTCYDRLTARVRADIAAAPAHPSTTTTPQVVTPAVTAASTSIAARAAAASNPTGSGAATPGIGGPGGTLSTSPASSSASPQDMFGARPVEAPTAAPERKELKSITAHVTALRDQKGSAVLDLDNGQRWQQLGHEDLLIKVGEQITISRGTFGSFWIVSASNRSDHVKRVS